MVLDASVKCHPFQNSFNTIMLYVILAKRHTHMFHVSKESIVKSPFRFLIDYVIFVFSYPLNLIFISHFGQNFCTQIDESITFIYFNILVSNALFNHSLTRITSPPIFPSAIHKYVFAAVSFHCVSRFFIWWPSGVLHVMNWRWSQRQKYCISSSPIGNKTIFWLLTWNMYL